MERALTIDALVAAPIGKYFVGPTWLYFYPTPDVSGFVLWGKLTGESLEQTMRIVPSVHTFASKRHVSIIDGRRVESTDAGTFGVAEDYVRTHHQAIGAAITSLAVIYPRGLLAAVAAGFFQVVEAPYPVKVLPDINGACEWLGIDRRLRLVDQLDALHAEATGAAPLLRDLRHALYGRLRDACVGDISRSLGVSERSLQRRLAEHRTSFQKELTAARIRAAEQRLATSDASLTEIAFEIGCASLPHFSLLFRKATGQSPRTWRAMHRSRRAPAVETQAMLGS